MRERLYIKEASALVDLIDRRSFRRWCKLFDLELRRDQWCKKLYVDKEEFENILNNKNASVKMTGSEISARLKVSSAFQVAISERKTNKINEGYCPKGEIEKAELSRLSKLFNAIS